MDTQKTHPFSNYTRKPEHLMPYIHNGKYGFKNIITNEIDIQATFDFIRPFTEGVAAVKQGENCGFIDVYGSWMHLARYLSIPDSFHDGLTHVCSKDSSGYINSKYEYVIPTRNTTTCYCFSDGLAVLKEDGIYKIIDKCGKVILTLPSDAGMMYSFSDGMIEFWHGFKYGYINSSGCISIPAIYDQTEPFSCERALVRNAGIASFIDKSGRTVISDFEDAFSFSENGLAAVKRNGLWGYVDIYGSTIIPFKFQTAGTFSENLACVCIGNKYGYIDKFGSMVIPSIYDFAGDFKCGRAKVKKLGFWGFIDNAGSMVIPCIYSSASNFMEGVAYVEKNNRASHMDIWGNTEIPL